LKIKLLNKNNHVDANPFSAVSSVAGNAESTGIYLIVFFGALLWGAREGQSFNHPIVQSNHA